MKATRKKKAPAKRQRKAAGTKPAAFDPGRIETQAQLDAALAAKAARIIIVGGTLYQPLHISNTGSAHVEAWESAHVVATGSAHVVAWESAHVEAWESAHVEARGSAHVVAWESAHVEAWGSAHVEAWGSAHVEAWESAHVEAWESAHVVAGQWTSVHKMLGHGGQITGGGIVIAQPKLRTALDWCAYHGVVVNDGIAILYKGVNNDFGSPRGGRYVPGTTSEAADWDGGKAECGGGLHFSPSPLATLEFHSEAVRFVACPVAVADMRPPNEFDQHPNKIKARRTCGPAVEVHRYGNPVPVPVEKGVA